MSNIEITLQYTETVQKQRTVVVSKEDLQKRMGYPQTDLDWDNISGLEIADALEEMQERNQVFEAEYSVQKIGNVTNLRLIGLDLEELPGRDELDSKILRRSIERRKNRLFDKGHTLAEHFGKVLLQNQDSDWKDEDPLTEEEINQLKDL